MSFISSQICIEMQIRNFVILGPKALATLSGYAGYPANRLPRLPLFRISASVARLLDIWNHFNSQKTVHMIYMHND